MAERSKPRRSSAYGCHLVVMAKSPVAGRVKRRLALEIGTTEAIRFYRTCLANTLRRLAADPRIRLYAAVAPDSDAVSAHWARLIPPGVTRMPQGPGDLGMRMLRIFRALPPGRVVIVGSDVPSISGTEIAKAFKLLGRSHAVFGRSPDGGYWLVGLKRCPKLFSPFARVRWSTETALADTLANLDGKTIAFVADASDVDDGEAYRALSKQWQRLIPPLRR